MEPTEKPIVICPQSGAPCTELPACDMIPGTGRTYCVRWVEAARAAGREALERK